MTSPLEEAIRLASEASRESTDLAEAVRILTKSGLSREASVAAKRAHALAVEAASRLHFVEEAIRPESQPARPRRRARR